MDVTLLVLEGDVGERKPTVQVPVVLGRSRTCGLRLDHPTVSRRHCQLFEVEGLVMVRDLGSLNGTLVDGQPVEQAPLKPGERLTIGPFTFQVEYEYEGTQTLDSAPKAAAPSNSTMPAGAAQTHWAGLLDDTTPAEDDAEPTPAQDAPDRQTTAPVKKPPVLAGKEQPASVPGTSSPAAPPERPAPRSEPGPPAPEPPPPAAKSPARSQPQPPAAPTGPGPPGPEDAAQQQAASPKADDEQLKDFLRGLS